MVRQSDTVPGPGGSRKLSPEYQARTKSAPSGKPQPQPVVIVPQSKPGTITRLGTPSAFLMLIGLFLVYYSLRGFDKKYGTFNGTFAGTGNVPTGTTPRYAQSNTATNTPPAATGA